VSAATTEAAAPVDGSDVVREVITTWAERMAGGESPPTVMALHQFVEHVEQVLEQRLGRLDSSHRIRAAMRRGELDEEEAFFILRFAGRLGYSEAIRRLSPRGPLSRARRWLIRLSGWEWPELSQWDSGKPTWDIVNDRGEINDPTPISILGGLATFFGTSANGTSEELHWGHVRVGGGYLVWRWRSWAFWSPDATPSHPRAFDIVGKQADLRRRQVH
jgi:hypothetical protein